MKTTDDISILTLKLEHASLKCPTCPTRIETGFYREL